jgi:hypothetical protein
VLTRTFDFVIQGARRPCVAKLSTRLHRLRQDGRRSNNAFSRSGTTARSCGRATMCLRPWWQIGLCAHLQFCSGHAITLPDGFVQCFRLLTAGGRAVGLALRLRSRRAAPHA